ncbi:MAG: hypothetical protein DRQ03_05195, partial [Candidatus Hydrothermota bacterium]
VTLEIPIFEVKSGEITWKDTSLTRANAFADYSTVFNSSSEELVKKLREEDIIEIRKENIIDMW